VKRLFTLLTVSFFIQNALALESTGPYKCFVSSDKIDLREVTPKRIIGPDGGKFLAFDYWGEAGGLH